MISRAYWPEAAFAVFGICCFIGERELLFDRRILEKRSELCYDMFEKLLSVWQQGEAKPLFWDKGKGKK